ncbi:hypothetical protein D9R12_01260 [Pseudoxanthomonas spadix]|nr:hypothetical protein D9R12_01260 [Pseudoxanthomonas spadix]
MAAAQPAQVAHALQRAGVFLAPAGEIVQQQLASEQGSECTFPLLISGSQSRSLDSRLRGNDEQSGRFCFQPL